MSWEQYEQIQPRTGGALEALSLDQDIELVLFTHPNYDGRGRSPSLVAGGLHQSEKARKKPI